MGNSEDEVHMYKGQRRHTGNSNDEQRTNNNQQKAIRCVAEFCIC